MSSQNLAAFALAACSLVSPSIGQDQEPAGPSPFVRHYLQTSQAHLDAGELEAAVADLYRCLERDDRNLEALQLLADVAEQAGDLDTTVYTLHRWLSVYDGQAKPPLPRRARRDVQERLAALDPAATRWDELRDETVDALLDLGRDYARAKDWLGAQDVYGKVLQIAPGNKRALDAMEDLRQDGGSEVAVEDLYAGTDPTEGLSAEQIAIEDRKHERWQRAYSENTTSYRIKTNAGFLVLKTAAIAMEQVNQLYRKFFHYQEDGGKTPKIDIRIFRSREEYLERGESPPEWSKGHFTGGAVETYASGSGEGQPIRRMYRTLFHEAAHQFVRLTGPVPGWLNEAYACFFEGCEILSNGSVRWNQVPGHRLFALARRMERGWMSSIDEAARDESGEFRSPRTAPRLRAIVASEYEWGPPWYAPTWGVVYFLYNFRNDDGRLVYRDALSQYYASFQAGMPTKPVEHFEEIVLDGSPLSPATTIDELDPIWRDWILELRDLEIGVRQQGETLRRFASLAIERGEHHAALEFLEEIRSDHPDDVEVLWQIGELLEQTEQELLAAARFRELLRLLQLADDTENPRYAEAERRIQALDPRSSDLGEIADGLETRGIELARDYMDRELPRMALEIARRLAALSVPSASRYYAEIARQTGISLARWRIAYNENDLSGWSAGSGSFQPYGAMIRSRVTGAGDSSITTEYLAYDVTFGADYSLEAEMRFESDGEGAFRGRLMGLAFGAKSGTDHHAVLLHPDGFLDISTRTGADWSVHDHRSIEVGDAWQKLRIDITGDTVDVYMNGLFVRSMTFSSSAAVQGGFGLIAGDGEAAFRNVRMLARDPFDPAARVERELAMAGISQDESLRQTGNFSGTVPPALQIASWEQGTPAELEELRGNPVTLLFWSPKQDLQIPCTSYFNHLIAKGREAGVRTIVVCDSGTDAATLRDHLAAHPMPDAAIAIDRSGETYSSYFIKAGYFGIPRVLLLDSDGKVVFEGDPGLRQGEEWQPADGPTYVDAAFDKLIGR